jgi:hypothetical protein
MTAVNHMLAHCQLILPLLGGKSTIVARQAFKEYFGIRPTIVCLIWKLLANNDLLPLKGADQTSSLGALFHESLPKTRPSMFCCWWIKWSR